MIIHYHDVIILTLQKQDYNGSSHRIVAVDKSHDDEIPKSRSSENEEHFLIYRNRVSRVPRYSKWMTGRSVATLHR